MRKNDKLEKGIFGLWSANVNATTTTSTTELITTMAITTTTTTTKKPIIFEEIPGKDSMIELLESVQFWAIVLTVFIALMIIYKLIQICRMGYIIHNERVISKHESSNPNL